MTLIEQFLTEHPFFCALLEHERRILAHYIELYRCPKGSYLVLPGELQEVLWVVVRGRLAEYSIDLPPQATQEANAEVAADRPVLRGEDISEKPSPLRYFFPGDLINVHALTEELIAPNEILSLEDETQVICMSAFHLAKLAQQQPKIHRALRPLYSDEGYLLSGLPAPVWRQMGSIPPPHTRDFGKNWLQRKPLLRTYCSYNSSILAFLFLCAANVWQFQKLREYPNIALGALSLLVLFFFVMQRYRCEYTLKHSLLHITERSFLGLNSKIKSYPLLSIREVRRIPIPLFGRLFDWGGLRIYTHCGEIVQIFPIDRVRKWQKALQEGLNAAHTLQRQLQNREGAEQRQKHHKLQPELIKEINYRNAEQEGKLQKSRHTLVIPLLPLFALGLLSLYYSFQSELLKIYLTIPLIAISGLIIFQSLRWLRYSWRISEEFLLRRDHILGHRYDCKIPIRDIQDLHLEYLSILGFGTISLSINDQIIRLQNLRHPQNILDEIESLRQCAQNPAQIHVWAAAGPALKPVFDASHSYAANQLFTKDEPYYNPCGDRVTQGNRESKLSRIS